MRRYSIGHYCNKGIRTLGLLLVLATMNACRSQEPALSPAMHAAREAIRAEEWHTALSALEEAIQETPQGITPHLNLAMVHWRMGNLNNAIAAFNTISGFDNLPPIAWELYAQLRLEAGDPQGAREILRNMDDLTAHALIISALADIEMQAYERARLSLENALDKDPTFAPAWYHLALLYRDHLPNMIEAQAAFNMFRRYADAHAAEALSESDFLAQAASPVIAPPATEDRLPAPPSEPDQPVVSPVTEQPPQPPLQEDPPATPAPTDVRGRILATRNLIQQGDTDTALLALKELVQQHPNHPDAVWELARFYDEHLGLKERADGLYQTFRNLFPQDPRVARIPTRSRPRQTDPRPQGTDVARRALLFQQALEHYNRQEWDASITAFRRVLSIDPRDASAAFNLGLAYKASGEPDTAATAFRMALQLEPDMTKALFMLGLTERERGEIPEALRLLNRLIRLQPDFAKAHHLLGSIYSSQGRPDMTRIHFQRFLEIEPDAQEAARVRQWLERNP